jgi:predicted AAA+ superfamily ATPase
MKLSPFNPMFGKRPQTFVGRADIIENLLTSYHDHNAPERITILSGVRGCGKTSILSDITSILEKDSDWIVINSSSTELLLENIIGMFELKLDEKNRKNQMGIDSVSVGLPFVNLEVSLDNKDFQEPLGFYPKLYKLLSICKDLELKVLFTIDELNNTKDVKEFISSYQLLYREDFDICLLMAGLPHLIDSVLNDEVLTFLRRANRIVLSTIDPYNFKLEYERIFQENGFIVEAEGIDLAYRSTGGYPYLFQLIGYFLWKTEARRINVPNVRRAIEQSKGMLYQNVYDIVLSELSIIEQEFLFAMSKVGSKVEVKAIRERLNKDPAYINNYKNRLTKRGIIKSTGFGVVAFTLPFFVDFLLENNTRVYHE